MIRLDVSSTLRLLEFVPESIAGDPEIIALSAALDPELRAVSASIIEAVILPRIADLPGPVLDAVAWGFRLNELAIWEDATLAGKRRLLVDIVDVLKRSGTVWAVRRIFDLLQLTGTLVEWWEEAGVPGTYRLRIDATEVGITLHALEQVPELTQRFAPKSRKLSELAVEANSTGALRLYPVAQAGRHMTIGFGP